MSRTQTVGVRELRQNLSVYLREVEAGHSYEVTARGRRVALLSPLSEELDTWDRLVAEGKVSEPQKPLDELGPPLPPTSGKSISEALQEVREDRI